MYTILLYSRTLHRCEAASVGYAHAPGGRRRWRWRHGSWLETPAASNLRQGTCVHPRARWRAPPRGTQRRTRHRRRCRAQGASVAAAAAAASLGVKPQAEAPHSAPVAPRGALRRRLRRRTTCTARARTQRQRLVAARARAGPTWESERSSSVARARQGARRKGRARRSMASGEMVGSRSVLRRAWSRPQRGGGARPRARRGARRGRELKGVRASTLKRLGCSQLGSRCPRVRARARGARSSDVATCAFFLRAREPKFSFRQRFVQDPPRPSLTDRPTRSGFSPAPRGSAGDRQRLPSWLQPCCARLFQGPQDICVQATLQSQFRACPNAPSSQ